MSCDSIYCIGKHLQAHLATIFISWAQAGTLMWYPADIQDQHKPTQACQQMPTHATFLARDDAATLQSSLPAGHAAPVRMEPARIFVVRILKERFASSLV